jgi:hypothetical protein
MSVGRTVGGDVGLVCSSEQESEALAFFAAGSVLTPVALAGPHFLSLEVVQVLLEVLEPCGVQLNVVALPHNYQLLSVSRNKDHCPGSQ